MAHRQLQKILTASFLLALPSIVAAAGLQISPAKLEFTLPAQSALEQTLTIVNPTADVQVFEVYADDFTDIIKAAPASFTLESGAKKSVKISVDAKRLKNNQHLGANLSVVGKPLADNKFSVGTGAKIPITISVTADAKPKIPGWVFWSIILPCLVLILTINKFRLSKQSLEVRQRVDRQSRQE